MFWIKLEETLFSGSLCEPTLDRVIALEQHRAIPATRTQCGALVTESQSVFQPITV